ncbi:MAG: biotin transporter BioY [Gemmatimonadales bacterium]
MERVLVLERPVVLRRSIAALLGAALVAAAAQVSVPLPGTPVPMTLQPLAVLLVGGLLGARLGAASLMVYLALGAAGLPVFTPTVPLLGIARLLGPTGGYLLAYPIAAFAVGRLADGGRKPGSPEAPARTHTWTRIAAGVFAGLALIHLGGLAQLFIITGDVSAALRFGTLPFLLGDLGKLLVAIVVLKSSIRPLRARL